ncbi:MAG: hypothetical protein J5737_05190 [Bacteroidales bacterium]|nr:hypothetical protein [Bacteroidales bacterium]
MAPFLTCCVQKIGPDDPAGRNISVGPSPDGDMTLQLVCNSNVKDYVRVFYHYRSQKGIHGKGNFDNRDTVNIAWVPGDGQVQLAFRAVKLRNTVLPNVFSRDEGVTFNVVATLRTPTDGTSVNWSGMYEVPLSNSSQFWNRTVTAINDGLVGQTPGTGTTRYLNFMIGEDKYGAYGITLAWKNGNLFEND